MIPKGAPVWIEYTVIAHNGEQAIDHNRKKFDPTGATL